MSKNTPKRIAFVIDPKADLESLIRYVLTSVQGRRDWWHVWNPHARTGRAQVRSQIEYAQALFVALSYAVNKAASGSLPPRGPSIKSQLAHPIRIDRTDKTHWPWASRVFNVIQAPSKYKAIRKEFRKGLTPLVRAISRRGKQNHPRIEVSSDCPRSVYFWDVASDILAAKDIERHADNWRAFRLPPSVLTRMDVDCAYDLSKRIPHPDRPETWQDLYRKLAVDPDYLSSERWIELTCHRGTAEPSQDSRSAQPSLQQTTDSPLTLREVVAGNNHVLLTGPAGAGKTTTLRMLVNRLLCEDPGRFPRLLPFFLSLKQLEPYIISSLQEYGEVDVGRLVGRSVSILLLKRSTSLRSSPAIRRLITKWRPHGSSTAISDHDLLEFITEEVSVWFLDTIQDDETILLLCDGINELQPWIRQGCGAALQTLPGDIHVLVSSRQDPGLRGFANYELQELSDSDIAAYLTQSFPLQDIAYLQHRVRDDPRTLAMACNPFWLSLIAASLRRDPHARIVSNKGALLANLVSWSISQKWAGHVHPEGQAQHDLMWVVLSAIAKWALASLTVHQTQASSSFTSSAQYEQLGCTPRDVLEATQEAEAYGLLAPPADSNEARYRLNHPRFSHDNIRDFFAAQHLLEYKALGDVPDLRNIMEYDEWDGALEVYFGLVNDEESLHSALDVIANSDPLLATRCLAWAKCATEQHAQNLLGLFPLDRLGKILPSPANHTQHGIAGGLCNSLSVMKPGALDRLFYSCETNAIPPFVVAHALVQSLGPQAFPYLKKFADSPGMTGVTSVLLTIRNLGTEDSWKYLCDKYIAHVKERQAEGEQRPDNGLFMMIFAGSDVHPPPHVVAKSFRHVKAALKVPDNLEFLYHSMVALVAPIEKAGKEYRQQLIELRNSPDKRVAEAAQKALRNQRDPVVVAQYTKEFQDDWLTFTLSSDTDERIKLLTELADAQLDERLWTIFLEEVVNHESHTIIPQQLAGRADSTRIAQVLSTVLTIDAIATANTIRAFAVDQPLLTLDYLKNRIRGEKKHTKLWYRLIVGRALCGDVSVKTELLDILSRIEQIEWVEKTRTEVYGPYVSERPNIPLVRLEFWRLVFRAVERLRLLESQPVLKTMGEESQDEFLPMEARSLWQHFTFVQIHEYGTAVAFARFLAMAYSDVILDDIARLELKACITEWSDEVVTVVLTAMRDVVEECLQGKSDLDPAYLYGLLSGMREEKGRRYLDVFAGWPLRPPAVAETQARSNRKRASSRGSVKRGKS